MNKKTMVAGIIGVLLMSAGAIAVISSYGFVTGYATIEEAINIDIYGSTNDVNYTISGKQGETIFSPKIKINNVADAPIAVNITATISNESAGGAEDITLKIFDANKTFEITNPVNVPVEDFYFYVQYTLSPSANIGNYTTKVEVSP